MIKLIIIARCIPEDVYLRTLEAPAPVFPGEKKFSIVIRDPETWYIGMLANEIKNRYEGLYKRPFGQIKYLKDNEDDCDLDPELLVADLLVDEGKAARDGSDQKRIVKVIQEQGRAVRQGSVIPDLTPLHYQPPTRPPVPRFAEAEKRNFDEENDDDRRNKRRRLGQIEEDPGEEIVSSIERHALDSGILKPTNVEPKEESPELGVPWTDPAPATRDELELLPEAPPNFQQRTPRAGLPASHSRSRTSRGPEIRETSALPNDDNQTPAVPRGGKPLADRFARQHSQAHSRTPMTPPLAGPKPGANAVSMLNGLKSASPALRQSLSAPTNKFRHPQNPRKDVYDYLESDIDDTQMSPRSRASRTKITPKLVRTPRSREQTTVSARSGSNRPEPRQAKNTPDIFDDNADRMDIDHDKENKVQQVQTESSLPRSRYIDRGNATSTAQRNSTNSPTRSAQNNETVEGDRSPALGTDETWSIQGDGTRRKKSKSRKNRAQRLSVEKSKSRSSSVASSARESAASKSSKLQGKEKKRVAPIQIGEVGEEGEDESESVDSPSAQLSQDLKQSSPVRKRSSEVQTNKSAQKVKPILKIQSAPGSQKQSRPKTNGDEEDDINRPPESVSDFENNIPTFKTPKRTKSGLKQKTGIKSGKLEPRVLKCFTCWGKLRRCDNQEPKCGACEGSGKNCQIYNMTREAAEQEKADRKAGLSKSRPPPKKAVDGPAKQPGMKLTPATSKRPSSKPVPSKPAVSSERVNSNDDKESDAEEDETVEAEKRKRKGDDSEGSENSETDEDEKSEIGSDEGTKEKRTNDDEKDQEVRKLETEGEEEEETDADDGEESDEEDEAEKVENRKREEVVPPKACGPSPPAEVSHGESRKDASRLALADQPQNSIEADTQSTGFVSIGQIRQHEKSESAILENSSTLPVPKGVSTNRAPSKVSPATSNTRILPAGMTEEEYDRLILGRQNYTEKNRLEQKLRAQKLNRHKQPSPVLLRSQSSQDDKTKTPSITSSVRVPASVEGRQKPDTSIPPPSTQPATTKVSDASSTPAPKSTSVPATAPPKARSTAPWSTTAASTSKKNLPQHPTTFTTAAAATISEITPTHQNPPFRPHQQAQRESLLSNGSTNNSPAMSMDRARSLKDLKSVLNRSRASSKSGAGTPQPTTAAAHAALKRGVAVTNKKGFSLSDDEDDDEESDSDSDSDSESKDLADDKQKELSKDEKKEAVAPVTKLVNGNSQGKAVVHRREETPSDSDSDSSGTTDSEGDSELGH